MEKKFCSIYEIYFLSGVFLFIFFVIFSLLNYFYFELDNFKEYFNNFNSTESLVGLGVLITQFVLGIFLLITNKNYTPCHIFIAFCIWPIGLLYGFFNRFNYINLFLYFYFIYVFSIY